MRLCISIPVFICIVLSCWLLLPVHAQTTQPAESATTQPTDENTSISYINEEYKRATTPEQLYKNYALSIHRRDLTALTNTFIHPAHIKNASFLKIVHYTFLMERDLKKTKQAITQKYGNESLKMFEAMHIHVKIAKPIEINQVKFKYDDSGNMATLIHPNPEENITMIKTDGLWYNDLEKHKDYTEQHLVETANLVFKMSEVVNIFPDIVNDESTFEGFKEKVTELLMEVVEESLKIEGLVE